MISCLLVQINRDQQGNAIREERLIYGDELSIGRGEECSIRLTDPRTNLYAASIKRSNDGTFLIDGEGTLLNIDGGYEYNTNLQQGTRILLGPYEISVEKVGGNFDLVISVELIHQIQTGGDATKKIAPQSLDETGLSKRKYAYWLAGITIVVVFLIPLTAAVNPKVQIFMAHYGIFPNQLWNPGMVSPGHISFGEQCFKCHELPFRAVQNETCLSCHKETKQHISNPEVEKHAFRGVSCTECHRDHHGSRPIAMRGAAECIQCHANIKTKNANADSPNITDFNTDHPAFKLSFKTGINVSDVLRVSETNIRKLVEKSELKFPHDQHVGLVEVPWHRKTIRDIKCAECHQPDAAGERFKPINMKQHCYSCHQNQLEFKLAPKDRKVPHGSEVELSNTLRDYYGSLAFRDRKSIEWINEQLTITTKSLSLVSGCGYCHTVELSEDSNNLLKITPVHLTQHWFPASKFSHAKHQTVKCAECHKVDHSEKSSDVAIPTIQSCKKCHTGMQPARGKVSSSCISCHTFHANMHIFSTTNK